METFIYQIQWENIVNNITCSVTNSMVKQNKVQKKNRKTKWKYHIEDQKIMLVDKKTCYCTICCDIIEICGIQNMMKKEIIKLKLELQKMSWNGI